MSVPSSPRAASPGRRILLFGATGTIGRATARALVARGHDVVAVVRTSSRSRAGLPAQISVRDADVTRAESVVRDAFRDEPFDAVVSCLASRTGAPDDAWAIDHRAHLNVLEAAQRSDAAGRAHFVLLSAICVQKPRLAFQHAKLAFEKALVESGMTYSIVRPTAYFKSLSGQVERVKSGKPFLVFGDGTLTACKPISDDDLAAFLADCLDDPAKRNKILPIGGPGEAVTPRQQGEALFALLGKPPRFRHVPVRLMDAIVALLGAAARVVPGMQAKAEFARIGRYYATESMLALDPLTGKYDASATPGTGRDALFDYYAKLIRGEATAERGDHAVF